MGWKTPNPTVETDARKNCARFTVIVRALFKSFAYKIAVDVIAALVGGTIDNWAANRASANRRKISPRTGVEYCDV